MHAGSAPAGAEGDTRNTRTSLALEQFLPQVTEVEHSSVLDLGHVWQSTVSFFTQAGCKLYTEDLFEVLHETRAAATKPDAPPLSQRFLSAGLQYPAGHFRGVLAWDLFDYLPEEVVEPLAGRLFELVEPGGALFLLCHKRKEESAFVRYRVLDGRTLELLPGSLPLQLQRTYENRALLNLFSAFHSTRNFIGRDNLRELFVVK